MREMNGKPPGKHVVVIGAGNSGMDTCRGAYDMGAETVVAVDVQKPAAFADERINYFCKSWLVPDKQQSILPGVFTAGDTIKPGRLTDAIGSGRKAAWYADQYLNGTAEPFPEKKKVPAEQLSTAYFSRCHHCDLGDPADDHTRCVSCGTCRDCKMCLESCPEEAITRIQHEDGSWEYQSDPNRCIGCGICAGVCPCGVWTLKDNPVKIPMYSTGQQA